MTARGGSHPDELISASLAGDLTDAERTGLDAHLAGCESCRATLAAFTAERRLVSGIRTADPPSDLSARVRNGIDAGRFPSSPWWRRPDSVVPLIASAAVFAAVVLAVTFFTNLRLGPVGQTSSPGASASAATSGSGVPSTAPSVDPTPAPLVALGPGQLGYLSLNGGPLEAARLTFVADATGASFPAGTVSGPPLAASLSPGGRLLAYITRKGQTGANEVWVLSLADGKVWHLGCSRAASFTDRLLWSSTSRYLAYTLVGIDLGPSSGCEAPTNGTDVWLFDATTGERSRFTTAGNAFAADFYPRSAGLPVLAVSYAASEPRTDLRSVDRSTVLDAIMPTNVFMPLFSPDGNRAIFWSGSMTLNGGSWHFSLGGMPQLSGDFRSTGPASPWVGTPLFTDLVPVGGEAFASGAVAWGPDSNLVAFWNGAWTGAPQSADGAYPSQQGIYVGRISTGMLTVASRLQLTMDPAARVMDVTLTPDGTAAAVTIGLPSAGIGDPPSANLQIVPLAGGSTRTIGGGVKPPPWDGPAVFGR